MARGENAAMRSDLATLTPEALAVMSNAGLVKRAQREIADKKGPDVLEEPDGTVIATFAAEGVITKLLPGKTLKDSPCSCGARIVCRHRIAAVLEYAAHARVEMRDPWAITADELALWLGPRFAVVDAAEAAGVDVELGIMPPTARFSGCTVRFLAGADLAHAKCDCSVDRCVHVPLAVRAFQRLSAEDRQRITIQIRLGPPPRQIVPSRALSSMMAYLTRLLEKGIADARGLDQARAEAQAVVHDCPWLDGVIEDIELQRSAWESRSALHDASRVRNLLMEGFARIRAAERGRDPSPLLGMGEALCVPLDRAHLLSLGARVSTVGSSRVLEVLFWDGATVVSWVMPIPVNAEIGTLTAVANVPLVSLATGRLQSKHLVRLARRTIEIRRGKETQVLPQTGEWGDIPAPYGFSGPSMLLHNERDRSPWFLRHRSRTESLRVIATPNGVRGLSWSPGRQTLSGIIEDDDGGMLIVERAYEWFAPGAITALAEALPGASYVSGWLRGVGATKILEPIALVTSGGAPRVIVPDLAPDASIPSLAMTTSEWADPLDTVLGRLEAALDTLAQEGVLGGRIPPLGATLHGVGLRRMAETYGKLEAARAGADAAVATKAWADAAIAVGLARARGV
jgi:hypothetical protein